jgi:hypothetical protein
MKLKMEVLPAIGLNVRTGPGTNYRIVTALPYKDQKIFIETKTLSNGQKWYKLESGNWSCGYMPGDGTYLKLIANLEDTQPTKITTPNPPTTKPTNETQQTTNSTQKTLPENPVNKDSKNIIDKVKEMVMQAIMQQSNVYGKTKKSTEYVDTERLKEIQEDLQEQAEDRKRLEREFANTNFYNNPEYIQNDRAFPTLVGQESNGIKIYNYMIDTSFIQENMNIVKNNINLNFNNFKELNKTLFTQFNRFKVPLVDYHLTKTFAHVFFTRPDLNLIKDYTFPNFQLNEQASLDSTILYAYRNNPNIIVSLTDELTKKHSFNPYLSNVCHSFELSDEYIKTLDHGETLTGYKIMYGKSNIESRTSGTFNVGFTDDREYTIYKIHKIWVDYISKVYRGELRPKSDYIYNKILDYASSVYYILCGEDGETILFWSKYYGVFPTSIPSSVSSWSQGKLNNLPEYSITYAYAFKEDFNPLALAEFNMNSTTDDYVYLKTYNPDIHSTGKSMAGAPFIETVKGDGVMPYTFKLRFRKL